MLRDQRRLKTRIMDYLGQNVGADIHFSNSILIRAFVCFFAVYVYVYELPLDSNYQGRKTLNHFLS
jgi:hypothetical protein